MIYIKISFPASVLCIYQPIFFKLCIKVQSGSSGLGLKMGKFYQCIQSYGPSFMTKFCSALLYLENLLTNIFAKLNLRGGVSCMPAALLFSLCIYYLLICYMSRLVVKPNT